ncbi:MAG: hypothetical protein Q3959_01470 [Limosilactobacillus sp.]|uniref:DUF1659 domain-containing protein n=1 Tax=Limosilactobacillus sp. TaxID=2773925 RepID=UPI0027077F21|nr:hypothetical protein [Limosilactobacillus sp.]
MSNERKFVSAKLQLTLKGENDSKGTSHTFNNLAANLTSDQIFLFREAIVKLANTPCETTQVITTEQY